MAPKRATRFLMLGYPDMSTCSFAHYIEELAAPDCPYRFWKEFTGPYTARDGSVEERTYKFYARDLKYKHHPIFQPVLGWMRDAGLVRECPLGRGAAQAFTLESMVETMLPRIRADPWLLMESQELAADEETGSAGDSAGGTRVAVPLDAVLALVSGLDSESARAEVIRACGGRGGGGGGDESSSFDAALRSKIVALLARVLGAEAVGGDGDKSGAATLPGDASLIERGLDSAAFVSLSGLLEDEFGDDVVGSVDDVMSLTTLDGLAAACAPFFASANGAADNGTVGAALTTPGAVAAAEFARDPPRVPAKPLEISFVGEGKTMVSALEHVAGLGLVASGHVRVVEVYTNPSDRLVASAAAAADPGAVVRAYAELKGDAAAERFTAVDWLFSLNNAAVIVRAPVLRMCRGGAFNLHPGKLPEYAGLHVAQWAIRNGDAVSAATLHWMDPGLDTGDIAFEHEVAIEDDDTGLTLLNKCFAAGVACFLRCLDCALRNGAEAMPRIVQDASRRRLYRTKDAVDGRIDFANLTARQVRDFVRAADYGGVACPTYTPFHKLDGEQVTDISVKAQSMQVGSSLKAADVTDTQVVAPSGTVAGSVLASGAGGYLVACKDGGVVWIRKME